jgi:DNA-directed RNA polymerase specialized sigma24 family protein
VNVILVILVIITIALNAARDLLRAQGRRREDPLVRDRDDELREVDIADPEELPRISKTPSEGWKPSHEASVDQVSELLRLVPTGVPCADERAARVLA